MPDVFRFLHTSDWHVGKQIRGRSRSEEFSAVLDEIATIAVEAQVDAVLVTGDLYEQRSPSPEAESIVLSTFMRLFRAGIRVVAIPGNHDSAARFDAHAELLEQVGVTVVPRVARPDAGGVIELHARKGSAVASLACIPFVPERHFGDAAALFEAAEHWYQSYAEGMSRLIEAMASGFTRRHVNVVMAHLLVDGARLGGTEREVILGPDYAVAPSRLPTTATYIALGHVHCPQAVKGAPGSARYAGSILQFDFGEQDDNKSVTIIEAAPGRPASMEEVQLSTGRRLATIEGAFDAVVAAGKALPSHFLRLRVKTDGPVPGIADSLLAVVPNAVAIEVVYEGREDVEREVDLSSLDPREQFLAYYRSEHAAEPDAGLLGAFDEVLAAEEGSR